MAYTYFWRDYYTLELITRHLIPFVTGRRAIRIWDAGCAMGPEPYTLLLILAEQMGYTEFKNLQVIATDFNSEFQSIIEEGVFEYEMLERIPEPVFRKYFLPSGSKGNFAIHPSIREKLIFRIHDLLTLEPIDEEFSLILCKNVLLHFQPLERADVVRMFHKALTVNGLFATEQTQKLPAEVTPLFAQITPDAQMFRKVKQ